MIPTDFNFPPKVGLNLKVYVDNLQKHWYYHIFSVDNFSVVKKLKKYIYLQNSIEMLLS